MVFDIKGKVAIITGGATGIGLKYVEELLKNGAEAVTIVDVCAELGKAAEENLNTKYGTNRVLFIHADVTKKEKLIAAFEQALAVYKSLDIVINNAGILRDSTWELMIDINCSAVVEGTLLGIKYMGKNNGGKGGVIVNIASILGLQELSGCPIYTGTKHFVIGFNRSFGQPYWYDLTGIKFVTMCPGVTDTPLISDAEKFALPGFPGLGQLLAEQLGSLPKQKTECVAKSMITLITKGENGSVWVSEGGQAAYEVNIPDRNTLKKN